MENLNFDSVFGSFTAADALAKTQSEKKSTYFEGLYKPSYKDEKCVDQNYKALIRFIPFIQDGMAKPMVERWECFLKDVNGETGIFVVSPKTVGKNCPIRQMSWKLYKSENAIDKANSKNINVYQQWYAIIEVVKDKQHPDYEGKHFIYQFGSKIKQKIEDAMKGSDYTDPINPFDLFNAPLFEINITKDNKKMDNGNAPANYDACKFIQKTTPIHFGDGMTLDKTDVESKKAFVKWLDTDAPKISNYFFKEWDAETEEKVNANLASYVSGYTAPRTTTAKAREIIEDISGGTPTSSKPNPKTEQKTTTVVEETEETSTSDEDLAWLDKELNS